MSAQQPELERLAREAANPDPEDADVLAGELVSLWDDLRAAQQQAANGVWSIACERIAYRIARLTLHTGKPTPWEEVSIPLLLCGWYEELHAALGVPAPFTAEDRALAQAIADGWSS